MNNKQYQAHSTERIHPYAQKRKPKKNYGCFFLGFVIMLIGATIILISISPKLAESKQTLDNTLLPELDVFPSETPTGTPTQTPTTTRTPPPTIDYQATQSSLDATKTKVAQLTQEGKDQELHQKDLQIKQEQLDAAMIESELLKKTLQYADPMATDQAKATATQEALNYEAITTPRALETLREEKAINQWDAFYTFLRWVAQLGIIGLLVLFGYMIWKTQQKRNKKEQIEIDAHKIEHEEEAKNRAFQLADKSKQLLDFIQTAIDLNERDSRKLPGHRDIDWLNYKDWKKIINLLKLNNRVFYKEGGHGVKGYYLTRGDLGKFFEEIASGKFPPVGSYGREETE